MATDLSLQQGLLDANTDSQAKYEELYGYGKMPGVYQLYTEVIPTTDRRVELNWITNHPTMRKWQGDRHNKQLRHYSQTLTFDKWEATLQLQRDLLAYDNTGAVQRAINTFMTQSQAAYDKQAAAEYDGSSGAGPTCFDGTALFNASHPHANGGGTQSNLGASTNLSHSALQTGEQTMMLLTHENGEPAQIQPTILRVGPKLKRRAQELISADRVVLIDNDGNMDSPGTDDVVAGATRSSVWQGDMTLVVDERITTFFWDLIDGSKGAKPMVIQENRFPELVSRTDMTDPARWDRDLFEWALEADMGVHAGHWLVAYRGTGTA